MSTTLLEHKPFFRAKAGRQCEDCGGRMTLEFRGRQRGAASGWSFNWWCAECGIERPEWWDEWIKVSAIVQGWRR